MKTPPRGGGEWESKEIIAFKKLTDNALYNNIRYLDVIFVIYN